jgi:hypothetical protein
LLCQTWDEQEPAARSQRVKSVASGQEAEAGSEAGGQKVRKPCLFIKD